MGNIPTILITPEGSAELQRQIELLKYYPEIFDQYFYPAMEDVAEITKRAIQPQIANFRRLQPALGSKVRHSKNLGTSAHIGFGKRYGMPSARMAAPLNQGVRPHEVTARRMENLHFSSRAQGHAIVKSIAHPGLTGLHFLETGLENATNAINARLAVAAEKVAQELAKP